MYRTYKYTVTCRFRGGTNVWTLFFQWRDGCLLNIIVRILLTNKMSVVLLSSLFFWYFILHHLGNTLKRGSYTCNHFRKRDYKENYSRLTAHSSCEMKCPCKTVLTRAHSRW